MNLTASSIELDLLALLKLCVGCRVVQSRVIPLIALEKWLLKVDHLAGTLITRSVARFLSHLVWGCIATVFHIGWIELLLIQTFLEYTISIRRLIVLFLRDVITISIYVVLEYKIVDLTCITWLNTVCTIPTLYAWRCQVSKEVLLLKLEISVELIYHKLLIHTSVILFNKTATAFCA